MFAGNLFVGFGMALMGLASLLPDSLRLPAMIASAALDAVGGPMKDIPVAVLRQTRLAAADGPAAALDIIDPLAREPSLAAYHLLPSVRGDLLVKLCRYPEARAEFERAHELARNTRDKEFLLKRLDECQM